jgi:hypothetical protein
METFDSSLVNITYLFHLVSIDLTIWDNADQLETFLSPAKLLVRSQGLIDQRPLANAALRTSAVTGGGSGIGFAFAKACHETGARVLIGDLKLTDEADQYVSKVKDSTLVFQQCDVSSWDDLHELITTSVKKFSAVPDVYAPIVGEPFPQPVQC